MRKKLRRIINAVKRRLGRIFSKTPQRKFFYQIFCNLFSLDSNMVLIESFHGQTVSDSGLSMAREILASYGTKYKIYFATENKKQHQEYIKSIGLDVELIDVSTFKYTKILAQAKYIISNASLPIYFIKRDGQKYLQTWHGTPLKTLGKKMRLGIESLYNVQHNFLQADYLTEPNEFTKNVIMNDYNLENIYTGKVVMAGYPRNEVFLQSEKAAQVRTKLGLDGKTVYAYMPTWRGTSNHDVSIIKYADEVNAMLKKLDSTLKDDQILFVNFHPILHGAVELSDYRQIKPFPMGVDNYTFLNCIDALITDYSSVFFDFSLTKKPVILFMYDYEEYTHDRGFCMDVRSLPFRQIYSVDELGKCLKNGECLNDNYENTEYFKTFFKYDSPTISKKLLNLLFNGDESGLKIIDYSKNKQKEFKIIYPKTIKEKADFATLANIADDNSIVLMEKKWFKKDVSPTLYDFYNDSFNYVITTMTVPRTYFEDLMMHLGVKSVINRVHLRDIKRTFPGLNVDPDFIREYSSFEVGSKVGLNDIEFIPLKKIESKNSLVKVSFDNIENYNLLQTVVLSKTTEILSVSPIDSKNCDFALYDVKSLVENFALYNKLSCSFGIIAEDKEKNKKLILFDDQKKLDKAKKSCSKLDKSSYYYTPFVDKYMLPIDFFRVNLKKLKNSTDSNVSKRLLQYDLTPIETEIAILPFITTGGKLCAYICNKDSVMDKMCKGAKLKKISCHSNRLKIKIYLAGKKASDVKGALLQYRSKTEELYLPLNSSIKEKTHGVLLTVTAQFSSDMPLKEVFWDLKILVNQFEYVQKMRVINKNRIQKYKLFFTNCQCRVDNSHIIFPYNGKGSVLCFCYREESEYDTAIVRLKEIIAYIIYRVFRPYFVRKKIWIVYEKFCKTAQDNSYYFFKYCMEQLSPNQKKNIYYVIDKRTSDYKNVAKYSSHVIEFMSIKHMLYCLAMNICISSDSTSHLYVWRSKPSVVRRAIKKKKELFLQHGVTALKQVHNLFGKNGSSPMTYFVTCSREEQQIVVNDFNYNINNVPITGFARWDVLQDKSSADNRFILLMPTWRSWLEEVGNDEFVESDYYKNYSALLTSQKLSETLEQSGAKLVFYLHPKFASYIGNFSDKMSKNIQCVPFGEQPLNELMMKCSMLITDYSSVCWDVLYQDKPVIYYQFDYEKYNIAHGSYINMETDLIGDRFVDLPPLIDCISDYAKKGFKPKEENLQLAKKYFAFRDDKNSKRIYEFLKQNGH